MLRDKSFANHKAPCIVRWEQPLQSVLALQTCSATDLFYFFPNIVHYSWPPDDTEIRTPDPSRDRQAA